MSEGDGVDKDNSTCDLKPGGFPMKFHWRILGTPAPVFPGFEIDICDRVPDGEKPDAVWHRDRAKGMLRDHPEIRDLFGNTPATFVWCLLFAGGQIAIALAVASGPWWLVCAAAYLIGAWINICLFNLAHECNHELVLGNRRWDRWLFTLTTLPMFLPGHHSWWIEHHVHHNDLGARKDLVKRRRSILLALKDTIFGTVIPKGFRPFSTWITTPLCWPIAAFMLVTQVLREAVGLLIYTTTAIVSRRLRPSDLAVAVLADEHLVSGYDKYEIRSWAVIYPVLGLGLLGVLFYFGGWQPIVYLFLSALFMTGFLHPVMFGLILSNSHFHGHRIYQPSSSYYGWLNWFTFNFGLHTEHHDLAAIPWHRLGKLHKIAPEYYDNLLQTPSYPILAIRFAFGSREAFNNEDYRNAEMLERLPASPIGG